MENEAFNLMKYLGSGLHLEERKFRKKVQKGTQAQWESLARVLRFEWFERVWTLQEICLAAHATVVCGSSQIDWSRFLALCMRLSVNFKELRLGYDLRFHHALRTMVDFRNGNEGPGVLLRLICKRKCTNDIDRVRGIMSHAFFQRFRDEHHREFIPLNDLTSENMDFEISTELLRLPEPLYTLSLVQHNSKTIATYAHPSWVPRFRQITFVSTLADEIKSQGDSWNASGGKEIGSLTPAWNVLRVKGVEVGRIEWQSSKITNKIMNSDENHTVKKIWQQVQKRRSSGSMRANQTKDEREKTCLQDFCRVFYLDNHFAGRKGAPVPYPNLEKQMANCLAYFANNSIEFPSSLRQLRENLERKKVTGNAEEFFSDALHHCRNRRFIVTSEGHLGLAPEISHWGRGGDKVCVLFGGQVPFLLRLGREKIDEYRLCGECFLLDLMHGKAMELGAKTKTFTLV